ncbi:TRAP transporter substrate-binding protein DctP [Marinomonas arenicola]|uniref:TRAP transporter substrate-binding protein DctP n=1 Tax=Marinomonas arenicola TaxID=569601 RepID=A0ABU9G598_9GAMM
MKIIKHVRKILSTTTVASALLLLGTAPIHAAESVRINFAGMFSPGHPVTNAQMNFKKEVEEATEGRVKVRVFPANQLGDYTQVFEELSRGTMDMGLINIPSQFDPRLEVMYLHYLATNYAEVRETYSPGSYLFTTMEGLISEQKIKLLGFEVDGFGGFGLTKLPENIGNAGSSKNILLRVPPMDIFKTAAEDQGFQTVSVPFAELYTSLQTGVADGWSGGSSTLNYLQFRDVIKYFVVSNNFIDAYGWLASDKLWKKLSAKDRHIIQEIALKYASQSIDVAEENDLKHQKLLKDKGVTVIKLSDEELQLWAKQAREETWPKLRSRLTPELIDSIQKAYQAKTVEN